MSPSGREAPNEREWKEIRFLRDLLTSLPQDRTLLQQLATLYTHHGLYEEGLALDRELVRLFPGDEGVHFDLACSLSLTGQQDLALDTLEHALQLGYDNVEWMMRDDDLSALHDHPEFLKLVGRVINRRREGQ